LEEKHSVQQMVLENWIFIYNQILSSSTKVDSKCLKVHV
jgi:hypothetical protein